MCSNHFCNFPGYLEVFQVSQTFQAIRKFSGSSGKYAAYPEAFQAIQKLFRSSGKYPAYPENIQPIRKTSSLSRWQCHPATQVFGPLHKTTHADVKCDHCDKRFTAKRNLRRNTQSKTTPFQTWWTGPK